MPSKVPTSTMSNAGAPAHARATPAAAMNRSRQAGLPYRPGDQPRTRCGRRGSPALAESWPSSPSPS